MYMHKKREGKKYTTKVQLYNKTDEVEKKFSRFGELFKCQRNRWSIGSEERAWELMRRCSSDVKVQMNNANGKWNMQMQMQASMRGRRRSSSYSSSK
jgi:hypothetical protein